MKQFSTQPIHQGEFSSAFYDEAIGKIKQWLSRYASRRMLAILLLGFSSGLPLALVGGTLQAWFKTSGADIVTIGFLSLLTQPYGYKFLWAPFLDKFVPPFLGRRRGWILCFQIGIVLAIAAMAMIGPKAILAHVPAITFEIPQISFMKFEFLWRTVEIPSWDLPVLFIAGLILAFLSASQDIAIDAYRADVLEPDERGLGASLGVEGYRIAMLTSGGLALWLADTIGWQSTYLIMSGFMLIGLIAVGFAPRSKKTPDISQTSLKKSIVEAFKDFLLRDKAVLFLLLIILYKLGDAFSHTLSSVFLLDLDFSLTAVAAINKGTGLAASLIGVFFGGLLMTRIGLFRALLLFGILQAVSNLSYMGLAMIGKNYEIAICAFFFENLCGGMGTAAFVALLMSLCNAKYTATQFALFTSLASLGRVYVGPAAGIMIKSLGWTTFYAMTAIIAVPGLLLLIFLKNEIDKRDLRSE